MSNRPIIENLRLATVTKKKTTIADSAAVSKPVNLRAVNVIEIPADAENRASIAIAVRRGTACDGPPTRCPSTATIHRRALEKAKGIQ